MSEHCAAYSELDFLLNGVILKNSPYKKAMLVPHIFTGDNKSIKEGLFIESWIKKN